MKQLFAATDNELLNVLLTSFATLPLIVPQPMNGKEQKNDFTLKQNFPNPFNPTTKISYTLNKESYVTLKVYDTSGKVIQTLADGYKKPASIP
ncbi:MAG: T9SS type A sorting domain-containing protein [Ignavibacteria bacterium]|nr:T9SS type A sorting domain-containing protein [Ignavibacteria bacterium]